MGVIKSNNVPLSASPFSMADIETAAKRILLRAQHQAEQLLAAAQAEAEDLKRAAHAQGLVTGHSEGMALGMEQGQKAGHEQAMAEGLTQIQQSFSSLSEACTAFATTRAELDASALKEVVKLAIAIARRITKRQGLIEPQVLLENLQEAIKLVVQQSDLRIAIHPSQRITLDEVLPQLGMKWPNLKHIEITDDQSLSPGGFRIYTRQGLIDADLDAQLDRLVADLLPMPTGDAS